MLQEGTRTNGRGFHGSWFVTT